MSRSSLKVRRLHRKQFVMSPSPRGKRKPSLVSQPRAVTMARRGSAGHHSPRHLASSSSPGGAAGCCYLAIALHLSLVRLENLKNGHMLRHRILDVREDALRWEVREWERRADEQSQLLAELLQLIGMPEI
ncbi:uncharacterized protein [Lolium perenne]|uniref:uncharacterized protein n=1 Tax=Lolium perenne TaxID=4522 RepID=UPI003A9A2E2F